MYLLKKNCCFCTKRNIIESCKDDNHRKIIYVHEELLSNFRGCEQAEWYKLSVQNSNLGKS